MLSKIVLLFIGCCLIIITVAHPPPHHCFFEQDIIECCAFPNATNEKDIEVLADKCDKKFPGKHDHKCAIDCFLNETKVMVNGKIDEKAAMALDVFADADRAIWNPILEGAVAKCANWAEEESYKSSEEQQECTHKAAFFISCVTGQMFVVSCRRLELSKKKNSLNLNLFTELS